VRLRCARLQAQTALLPPGNARPRRPEHVRCGVCAMQRNRARSARGAREIAVPRKR
jgi:hypothetical protein